MATLKEQKRHRKHRKIRSKISGTASRPRLSVFKSNTAIYAQIIDDENGKTLVSVRGSKAEKIGSDLAKLALEKKIEKVVFDRGGYVYTGKIQALAEGARKGGLKF